jgi:hypothetical protein
VNKAHHIPELIVIVDDGVDQRMARHYRGGCVITGEGHEISNAERMRNEGKNAPETKTRETAIRGSGGAIVREDRKKGGD